MVTLLMAVSYTHLDVYKRQALLVPQVAQQARHALFEAGEQIGEAGRVLGEVALCVLIYEKPGQRRHGLVVEVEEEDRVSLYTQ